VRERAAKNKSEIDAAALLFLCLLLSSSLLLAMLRTILRIGSATSTRSWRSPRTPLQYHRHPLQNVLVARGFAARPRIPPEQNAKRLAAIAAKRKRKDAKALRAAALGDEPLSEPSSKSLLSLWDEIERNNAEDDEDADAASVPTEPIDDERLLQELEALSSSDKPRVAQQARATSRRQTARTTRPSLSLDDDDDDDGNDEDEILALEGVRTEVRMKPVSPEELTTRAEESDRAWIAKALRSHTPLNPYRDVADLSTQQASEIMKDLSPGEQMQMQERLRSQRLGQTRAIAKYINAYYAPAVSWYNNTCNPDDDPNKSADSIPAMQLIEQYLEATTKQPAKSKSSTSPKQAAKLAAAAKAASGSMAFETIEPDDPNNPPREVNSWERPVARYLNTPTIVRYLDGETTICGARVPRNMLPYLQDPNVPEEQVLSPRRSARLQAYEALLERKKIRKETKHKYDHVTREQPSASSN